MFKYTVYVLLIATLVYIPDAKGKRTTNRIRRPKNEDDSTPQPSVVSYSTFGFNDVGSYDGFVPTSPDYASFLSNGNQESTTRLYAPAFPSAPDSTGYSGNFGVLEEYNSNDDSNGGPQSSMVQYPSNNVNFFSTPNFENSAVQSKNFASSEVSMQTSDSSGTVYGTKIGSKNKKPASTHNNTEFNVYSSGPSFNTNNFNAQVTEPDSKVNVGESGYSEQNFPHYVPNYPSSEIEEVVKTPTNMPNALKFPRIVDFTKIKQYYPTELDNKYQVATYSSIINTQNENMFANSNENQANKFIHPAHVHKENSSFNIKPVVEDSENESAKPDGFPSSEYSNNFIKPTPVKSGFKGGSINSDYKDNYKHKWASENNSNDSKNIRNPYKGYEYSTNYSNTSFKYDYTPDRKPFNSNSDELVPASSNIDFTRYNFPDTDYLNFKRIPEVKIPFDEDDEMQPSREKIKSEEFLNQFKHLYTNTPINSPSQWGSGFKNFDFSYKHRSKKPQYDDSGNSDVVHIPKRPQSNKYSFGKFSESKPEIPKYRPYKLNKFEKPNDWSKEVFNTRFKSEEDLLGLRNHDTSHPSYLPSHRPSSNDLLDESDYKKLVDKWRQSYLKSKYKDAHRDYEFESYASEEKPLHVPIPKPYPIEVPHPVIVPVPQPYPVRVPVPKPVAVPVIRELTVPIEKPVPYPVIKKVPYPVEKPVPVPVEKEVSVPVVKPYPVHIPHIRPVFHHSRRPRDEFDSDSETDDEVYAPRPGSKKKIPVYKKKPKTTHSRPRRPTRVTYHHHHDRSTSRRRSPSSYRSSEVRARRPSSNEYHTPYRHRDFDSEREYESENSDYYRYCQRTGNC